MGEHKMIDVRNMPARVSRLKKVSSELDRIRPGEEAEIISDDEKMLKLAPQMIKSTRKADFVKSWKGEDNFYHTLVKKI